MDQIIYQHTYLELVIFIPKLGMHYGYSDSVKQRVFTNLFKEDGIYLFVLGGGRFTLNLLQIFNVTSNAWLDPSNLYTPKLKQ